MIAVVRPSSRSTSGRARVGMKPCTNELYVSLIIRCDSAAIVLNTSELLPEPETPVNTVSRRFGISTLMSLRLFARAPTTRITSWLSARGSAGACMSVVVAVVIVFPSVGGSAVAVYLIDGTGRNGGKPSVRAGRAVVTVRRTLRRNPLEAGTRAGRRAPTAARGMPREAVCAAGPGTYHRRRPEP